MKARILSVSMLMVALAVAAAAQSRPDFSGTWIPVDSAGTQPAPPPQTPDGPPPPPPPPRTVSMKITQSSSQLVIDRRVYFGGQQTLQTFVYRLDGSETTNQMGAMTFRTRGSWNSNGLLLTSVVSFEGNAIGEVKDTYRVLDGQLIVETVRTTPSGTFAGRTVHQRQQ